MTFFQFIQIFMLLIALGSLTITGWFLVTRGHYETMPNGRKEKRGYIFRGWYFFWLKTKDQKEVIEYRDQELENVYERYLASFPKNEYKFILSEGRTVFFIAASDTENLEILKEKIRNNKSRLEMELQCKIEVSGNSVTLYQQYDQYVFPRWIRMPIAQCATCFSSIYGIAFYSTIINLNKDLFLWTPYTVIAKLFFGLVFCLTLAILNTVVANKVVK